MNRNDYVCEIDINNILFDWKFYLVNTSELNEQKIYKKNDVMEYFKKNNESIYNTITKRENDDNALKLLNNKKKTQPHVISLYVL